MIYDIYEQSDLFSIAKCKRKSTLIDWLNINRIPFLKNARGEIQAHKSAIDEGFGVLPDTGAMAEPELTLGYGE